ncbi:MAG: TlpA disulfide reductase family protein [Ignavibacteriales bacterium]|nr:TlpA disulfide reductase family protein [Ignavibacteriales bacterium]
MRILALVVTILCASALYAQEVTVISGKLLGYDKKPMLMAHAHLLKTSSPKPLAQVRAKNDGSFEITTKETGLLVVEFTGVSHRALDVPFLVEKPLKIELSVSLSAYSYADEMKDVKIMTDMTDYAFDKAQPMQKQSDGTYAIELQTTKDKVTYQVLGAEKTGRSINGTQSDAFEYDDAGDYRSIVAAKEGKVKIVFDPSKTLRSTAEGEVKFSDPTATVAKLAGIQMEIGKRAAVISTAMDAFIKAGNNWKNFTYDWSADQASIVSRLKTEKDPIIHQALLMDYVDTKSKFAAKADPAMGARMLKEVPPDSKLWMMPTLPFMKAAWDLCGDENAFKEYLTRFLDKNPDMSLKSNMLMSNLMNAKMTNDEKTLKLYYDVAVKFFGDSPIGKSVKERFSPVINIAVGKAVPAFKVKSLEDTTKFFTNNTFKGRVYMIDFWATWCGPCVGEMENLHKAYGKFKSKNFQILSLSLDKKPEDVAKFRADKWKMPWLHTFVTEDTSLTNSFEVIGIPRPLLVDGNGKIIAMETELRGEQLEKTLAKFLGEPK